MADLVTYILHLGIVRVLSVPAMMGLAIWLIWRAATPPPWDDEGNHA